MRRVFRHFAALFLLLAIGAAGAADSLPVIAVLHTNDVHGRYAASEKAIGHDRIAAIFRETRCRIPATILLDAGDAIQGTPLVKWNKGEAAIEIMNAAGYDGLVLGNHEFDYGWDNIPALIRASDFPFFTQPVVAEGIPGLEAVALYERGGHRIGVFGLTTPETKQSSNGGRDKTFGDSGELVAYANAMAMVLRNAGAEIVICLAHLGIDDQGFLTSYQLRDRMDGVDLIIDGHSHTPLAEIVQAEGRALIVSTGEHAEALGLVEFRRRDGRLFPVARSIAKAETETVVPDPAVTAVIAKWEEKTRERTEQVVTWSPAPMEAERLVVRTRESELGNLLADAMRDAGGSDVALINGGNIRAPLSAGEVTAGELDATFPYDNIVMTAKVRGGALREALELSVSRYPGEFGGFLHVSGLAFAFDPGKPAYRRVTTVAIDGKPLDDDRLYSVTTCDWIADGGDGYEMFVQPFAEASREDVPALIDVFARYLDIHREEAPTIEGRIVVAGESGK